MSLRSEFVGTDLVMPEGDGNKTNEMIAHLGEMLEHRMRLRRFNFLESSTQHSTRRASTSKGSRRSNLKVFQIHAIT
jgi:hypothetical protein